jgi:hypothetical protein
VWKGRHDTISAGHRAHFGPWQGTIGDTAAYIAGLHFRYATSATNWLLGAGRLNSITEADTGVAVNTASDSVFMIHGDGAKFYLAIDDVLVANMAIPANLSAGWSSGNVVIYSTSLSKGFRVQWAAFVTAG